MKFLTRYDSWIAITGSVLVLIGYVWGVVQPSQLKAKTIRHEIDQTQSQLESLPTQIVGQDLIHNRIEQRREQAKTLAEQIPVQVEVSDVLRDVAQLASQSTVTILRLEPHGQRDFANYSALPFTLIVSGEFAGVTRFLSGLETQPRLVTFDEVTMRRSADARDLPVQATISLKVYSRHADSARVAGNTIRQGVPSSDN